MNIVPYYRSAISLLIMHLNLSLISLLDLWKNKKYWTFQLNQQSLKLIVKAPITSKLEGNQKFVL